MKNNIYKYYKMSCNNCDNKLKKVGGVVCAGCQQLLCSCCLHQKVGIYCKEMHHDIIDPTANCKSLTRIVYNDKWCKCCPIDN